jgi:CheY-like chemotaxis protein
MAAHVALILHELGTNSIKYGVLSAAKGWVTVSWTVVGDVLNLRWMERGGPMVSAPSRRGFGTTLIEQSAKSEGGNAERIIEPDGLTWKISLRLLHFAAPGECKDEHPTSIGKAIAPQEGAESAKNAAPLAGLSFLVVEDELLIGLDLVDRLERLGADAVQSVSSKNVCLQVIETNSFDCALLDANLHGRPVDEIAAALTRRKVPFVFVTGYGRTGLPAAFQQAPALLKPVSDEQLTQAVTSLVSKPSRVVRLGS